MYTLICNTNTQWCPASPKFSTAAGGSREHLLRVSTFWPNISARFRSSGVVLGPPNLTCVCVCWSYSLLRTWTEWSLCAWMEIHFLYSPRKCILKSCYWASFFFKVTCSVFDLIFENYGSWFVCYRSSRCIFIFPLYVKTWKWLGFQILFYGNSFNCDEHTPCPSPDVPKHCWCNGSYSEDSRSYFHNSDCKWNF